MPHYWFRSTLTFGDTVIRKRMLRTSPRPSSPASSQRMTRRSGAERGRFRAFLLAALKNFIATMG